MQRRAPQATWPMVAIQAIVIVGLGCVWTSQASEVQKVVVHFRDGGRLVAEIDGRSGVGQIWLRFAADSTVVLRPIPTERVVGLTVGDRTLIGEAIHSYLEQMRPEQDAPPRGGNTDVATESPSHTIDRLAPTPHRNAGHGARTEATHEPPAPPPSAPAASRQGGGSAHRLWPTYAEEALRALDAQMPERAAPGRTPAQRTSSD